MFKKLLTAAAFVGVMGAAQSAMADPHWSQSRPPVQAHQGWNDDSRYDHRHDRAHRPVRSVEVLERSIERRVRNASVPLLRGSGIRHDFRGYRVEQVVVTLYPHRSRGRIGLVVNGYRVDAASIGANRVVRLETGHTDVLGRELKSLSLDVDGRAYVKDVKIRLSRPVRGNAKGRYGFVTDNVSHDSARLIARAILAQITGQHTVHGRAPMRD